MRKWKRIRWDILLALLFSLALCAYVAYEAGR
jgi:hypothetical protein